LNQDEGLNSPARLSVVESTGLLDSSEEHDFDQLTRLASRLLRVPAALVTVLARDRQYVKSSYTEDESTRIPAGSSQAIDISFCRHAVETREPLLIEDARVHPRVQNSAAVAAGVLSYAGIPLEIKGEAIGALCVIDSRPRSWSSDDVDTLRALARSAMRLIEERMSVRDSIGDAACSETDLERALSEHLRSLAAYEELLTNASIDLEAEKQAQDAVKGSLKELAEAEHRSQVTHSQLSEAVSNYISLENERSWATEQFAAGSMSLSELEGCILSQEDALARLRVLAFHRDGEP
jgi:predicted transcriptional regulator